MFLATSSESAWLSGQPDECCIGTLHGQRFGSCLTSAFQFAIAFSGSPKLYRIFFRWLWKDHGGCEPTRTIAKLQGSRGRVLETHHQTISECFWQTLTYLKMSLDSLLHEEKRPVQLGHSIWGSCHLFHRLVPWL